MIARATRRPVFQRTPAVLAAIELVEGVRERQPMRDDNTRFGASGDDQIAQACAVSQIMIAAHANGDVFAE